MREHAFAATERLRLTLKGVVGDVIIRGAGRPDAITVALDGDKRLVERLNVKSCGPGHIVIADAGGSRTIVFKGRSGSSLKFVRGTGGPVIETDDPPKITVEVPPGIAAEIEADETVYLSASGLGDVAVSLSGMSEARIAGVRSPRVRLDGICVCKITAAIGDVDIECGGKSVCEIEMSPHQASGDGHPYRTLPAREPKLKANAAGMSEVEIKGDFEEADLAASGMGKIVVRGECGNVDAAAEGMGAVRVAGRVTGRVQRRCDFMASVKIG